MLKKEFNILGELERAVLEVVWQLKRATVREVLDHLPGNKKPAYTTVMTVMTRLYNKGILKRRFKNDAYVYKAKQDRNEFFKAISKKIIANLINKFGKDAAVAGFIDVLGKTDIKQSRELREKLKRIIK